MRMSEAEKKAAGLPPKLTVPMILFFLPVLFIVILGPAAIKVMGDTIAVEISSVGPSARAGVGVGGVARLAQVFAVRQHLPQIGDIGGGFVGRQIGAGDVLGLGEAALQADHKREVLPHPRIDRRMRRGAAQRGLGLAADSSTARKRVRDSTIPKARRERSSARSGNSAALRNGGPFGRAPRLAPRECASRAGPAYGRGRALATPDRNCRRRPARDRKRRARPCCAGFRSRPSPGWRRPGRAARFCAAPARNASPRRRSTDRRDIAGRRPRRRGAGRALG